MMTRRLATVGLILTAVTLVLSASVQAEHFTYQSKDQSAYVSCYDYDPASGFYTSSLYAYWSNSAQHVAGGGTNDYTYGYVYYQTYDPTTKIYCSGYGEVTDQSFSKLTSASMSATITLYCYDTTTIDPNTGDWTLISTEEVPVEVALTGTGVINYRWRYGSQSKDPPFFTSSYSASGASRNATDTILIDGQQVSLSNCYASISSGKSSSTVNYNPSH
jgi:hypothetical protein